MQGGEERERERDRHKDRDTERERERDSDKQRWEREGSASSSGASHRAPMDASLPPSVPSLPMDRTASNGGISGLGVADLASDSDLPPDVGADAELLVAEGSASFSGMSWHGMAEPGSLDVNLPPALTV